MATDSPVLLYVSDRPVLSSLQFALSIEGFAVGDGQVEGSDPSAAAALVIDQGYEGDGRAFLAGLRASGCGTPAIVLVTNPTRQMSVSTAALGAVLIEKPLRGDELADTLNGILHTDEAA